MWAVIAAGAKESPTRGGTTSQKENSSDVTFMGSHPCQECACKWFSGLWVSYVLTSNTSTMLKQTFFFQIFTWRANQTIQIVIFDINHFPSEKNTDIWSKNTWKYFIKLFHRPLYITYQSVDSGDVRTKNMLRWRKMKQCESQMLIRKWGHWCHQLQCPRNILWKNSKKNVRDKEREIPLWNIVSRYHMTITFSISQKLCLPATWPIQGWARQHPFMKGEGATGAPLSLSVYKQLMVAEEGRNIFFSL